MRSRNGARHPSSRGGMNRTRGCTGLVAAPDSWLHRTRGCTGLAAAPDSRLHRTRGCTGLVAAPDSWLHRTRGGTGLVAAPDSWRHRTRGCTGLVAAPDPRPCAHSFTQSRASPPVGPVARGLWPPTFFELAACSLSIPSHTSNSTDVGVNFLPCSVFLAF